MARILTAAVAFFVGLLPLAGQALGLGEIRARSSLGQPFVADIPLAIDSPDELRDLSVVLAPAETFARFGLDRPPALAELRFSVDPSATPPVIRVSSSRPVSEPFLSLLLEISWPKGRLLREYTVLLDPPAFDERATPAAAVPPVAPRPAAAPRPVERAAAAPAPVPAAAAPAAQASGGDLYTVVRGDTLSAIALQARPDPGVSLNQVMLALYRANPEAFLGNINRLKAGAVLRLPSRDAMTGLGPADADAEVSRQMAEWREPSGDAGGARLQLVPPAPGTVPTGAQAGRVRELEAELAETRRLLEVRNRELQALQQRLGVGPAALPAAATAGSDQPETAVERLPGEGPAVAAPAEAPAAAPADQRARRPRTPKPPVDGSGSGLADTVGTVVLNQWFLGAAALVLLAAYLLYRRRTAGEYQSRYADDGPQMLSPAMGAGAARRGDEPFLVEEDDAGLAAAAATGPIAAADLETPLERTISAEGGMQLDQSDAIAEADFHSAYGLYDQAAEILNRALRAEPDRRDLRLKLLEVYFSWENKAAFLDEARAFRAQLGSSTDPDWRKVVIMGSQLCPGEPLFAGSGDAGTEAAAAGPAAAVLDLDLDLTADPPADVPDLIDFDLGDGAGRDDDATLLAPPPGSTTETPTIEVRAVDAPATESPTVESPALRSTGTDAPTMETPTIESPTIESLLDDDFDLTDAAGPAGHRAAGDSPTVEAPTLESVAPGWVPGVQNRFPASPEQTGEIDLEDLGLDLTGLDEAATGLQNQAADLDLGGMGATSVSLPGLDAGDTASTAGPGLRESDPGPTPGDTAEQPGFAIDDTAEQPRGPLVDLSYDSAELAGLDFDLDDGTRLGVEPTASLGGGRGPDGPTMTEVGTKLDLARAYIDMGDPDGARSILNEVLEEGDPGQRQEALKLLTELTT
jgi:pilus assembly protein FimV